MTCVAWDGKTLAADRQAGVSQRRSVTKIRRAATGELLGCCGTMSGDQELMAWYEAGATPETFPAYQRDGDKNSHMIVVAVDGSVRLFTGSPFGSLVGDSFLAIGSGMDYAAATMHLGFDARRAVEVATELDASCGMGIDTLTLEPRDAVA